jgi:class 3 adenylate cyclase
MNIQDQLNILRDFRASHRKDLLTLVFADLSDTGALKTRLGDSGFSAVFANYLSRVRNLLKLFPSREVNVGGDPFFIIFENPADAVRFSIGLHEANQVSSREIGESIRSRVGIHIGPILLEGQALNLTAIEVNTCAQLMAICRRGGTIVTRIAADNAQKILEGTEQGKRLSCVNLGFVQRKGLGPLEIFEVSPTVVTGESQGSQSPNDLQLLL